jgi:hypothetical protein
MPRRQPAHLRQCTQLGPRGGPSSHVPRALVGDDGSNQVWTLTGQINGDGGTDAGARYYRSPDPQPVEQGGSVRGVRGDRVTRLSARAVVTASVIDDDPSPLRQFVDDDSPSGRSAPAGGIKRTGTPSPFSS